MNNVCVVIKRDKVADSLRDIYLNRHQRIHFCKRLTYQLIRLAFIFQFIVVSLKDGMFNNANVLFRTKFVDGVSTVSAICPVHSRSQCSPSCRIEQN